MQSHPHRFPAEKRLRKRSEFSQVYAKGRAWNHPLVAIRLLPNQLDHSRFGFAVSKRVGKAVVRNLVKRRLRELIRQMALSQGYDVVITGRTPAAQASFQELQAGLQEVLRRARLLATADTR